MTDSVFKSIKKLYHSMDTAWEKAALSYGFECNGCKDNCCRSLFFHHTYIEKAYLRHGFNQLKQPQKNSVLKRAGTYCKETVDQTASESKKIMCPVNEKGRCLLYPYRPMICRLHGLPHELCRPGQDPMKSPGCEAGNFNEKHYVTFDRTPFYRQMAQIELSFRQAEKLDGKIKQTIAQMISG